MCTVDQMGDEPTRNGPNFDLMAQSLCVLSRLSLVTMRAVRRQCFVTRRQRPAVQQSGLCWPRSPSLCCVLAVRMAEPADGSERVSRRRLWLVILAFSGATLAGAFEFKGIGTPDCS